MSTASPGPGGRRLAPPLAALVLVVASVASVLAARPASEPVADRSAAPSAQLVRATRLGCPAVPTRRGGAAVRVGLADVPGAGAGGPVLAGGRVDLVRGRTVAVAATDGPSVRASGPAAVGLFGWRTDRAAGRTLAVTSCVAPRADWWFTGGGAGLDHTSTLVVANLDPGPAVVDVSVLGPDGPVETVGTTGVVLAPGSRRRFALTSLAPQTDELEVRVQAVRGRVAASVLDARRDSASAPTGSEWLPGAEAASRTVWVTGVPSDARRRTLLVANPSPDQAVVDVAVSGTGGTFTPTGLDQDVGVGPGEVRAIQLADVPGAVRVRSTVPVVAAVRSTSRTDETVAGSTPPLTGPAAAPAVRGGLTTVRLTATDSSGPAATATLEVYDARGRRLASRTLTVPPGATVAWRPGAGGGTVAEDTDHVLVRPTGSAPLVAAVTCTVRGGGVATVPLVDLPVRVLRPAVQPGP